jgi:membrane protein
VRPLQVVLIVLRGFFLKHQCLLRASALTYTTLLALVPMLAFMFAFLKGLGVQNQLEPLLIDKLSAGSEETVRLLIGYVNKVEVGTLGIIGLGALLFSTLLQLETIERALNEIWGVRRGRTLIRRVADYVSMMVIAPVLLLLALTVNAALKSQTLIATLLERRLIGDAMVLVFTMLPYVAMWGAFTFFYAFIPNTRVKLVPALCGGVFAGTLRLLV